MKMWKRIAAAALAVTLALSLCVPAMAAEYAAMLEASAEFDGASGALPQENAAAAASALPPEGTYVEGELLVKVRRSTGVRTMARSGGIFDSLAESVSTVFSVEIDGEGEPADSHGSSTDGPGGTLPAKADWMLVELAGGVDMLEAWNRLLGEDTVMCVEPNYIRRATASSIDDVTEFDPYIHSQTWLERINAPAAWDALGAGTPGDGVVVAVVDTGVDIDHPDLAASIVSGYDFVNNDIDPNDENGHGTHVAGIVAAAKNGEGARGVACGAKIMPVRVLDANGSGSESNIVSAILYAAGITANNSANQAITPTAKADVINMSLGGFGYSSMEQDAVNQARAQGCLVVVAAGNESLPTTYAGDNFYGTSVSPGGLTGALTVMAMKPQQAANGDWLADFSNYDADPGAGDEYEIMAPGVNILSTYMGGGYGYMNGTSMACPVVAGAAAVLMGMGASADEAWALLVGESPVKQGKTQPNGTVRSYPALDLASAVEAAKTDGTYTIAPQLINCGVSAVSDLTSVSVRDGGGTMNLSDMAGSSRLFFKGNTPLSALNVFFENTGGSGTVTVSGTVGGVTVSGETEIAVPIGESGSVRLNLTDMPTVNTDGSVTVALTLTCEGATAAVNRTFTAYDVVIPEGIAYNATNSRYELSADRVSIVNSGTSGIRSVLCLDADLFVASGKTLIINNSTVLESVGADINVEFTSATDGGYGVLEVYNSELRGAGDFYLSCDGYLFLGGCDIYDPYITASRQGTAQYCQIIGAGRAVNTQFVCKEIYQSGFYYLDNLWLSCYSLTGSMVNSCTNTEISIGKKADANTFVENFGSNSESVLKLYAPDYSSTQEAGVTGFGYNNVVGPMEVYKPDGTTRTLIGSVYYQGVNGTGESERAAPTGVEDYIVCSSESNISENSEFPANSGFAAYSPAFVTGVTGTYSYNSTYGAVCYNITYTFSTPVDSNCRPWVRSSTNRFDSGASAVVSGDGKTCTVTVMSPVDFDTLKAVEYYRLSGYYTAAKQTSESNWIYYSRTSMAYQSAKRFPVSYELHSTAIERVSLDFDNSDRILTWSDSRYTGAIPATVYRSQDGGEYVKISGESTVVSPFTDSAELYSGRVYDYKVTAEYQEKTFTGYTGFVYSLNDAEMGISLTDVDMFSPGDTVAASLSGPWQVDGTLTLTIPAPALKIESIEFADSVKNSGAVYGAQTNEDGSATIMIGLNDYPTLLAGPMFTLKLDTSGGGNLAFDAANGEAQCEWDASDAYIYAVIDGVGTVAVDEQHYVCYATYSGNKMTATNEVEPGVFDFEQRLGGNDRLKVFFLGPDGAPLRECAEYPARED